MQLSDRTKPVISGGGAGPHPADGCGRVLIVDDEPNVRLTFRTALESAGFRVDEAADGVAALERLGKSSWSVVLLDLQMPELGGMEVLRRIRDAGNGVPVVIVTAHGTVPDAVEAMKLGAIDFLSKPVTPGALRRVASEVLARHAPEDPSRSDPAQAGDPTVVTLWPAAIDLTAAKVALNRREFERAGELLEQALDTTPDCAEALALKGVLLESQGQDHAAYHNYKQALAVDPHYVPARDNLRRYCERFGLDAHNRAINPADE